MRGLKGILFMVFLFMPTVICAAQDTARTEHAPYPNEVSDTGRVSYPDEVSGTGSFKSERFFHRGNDYYEQGEYLKAIEEYGRILEAGYESAPVYYNTANAYFKSGELGKALLNYARAIRLAPRDADLRANYRFAASTIVGEAPVKRGVLLLRIARAYSRNLTINELLWISTGFYAGIMVLLFIALYRLDFLRRILSITLVIFLLFIFNTTIAWQKIHNTGREAVVIVSGTESRYGPFDSATVFFKLHEGMRVNVIKYKDDWAKIKRVDGKVGWIPKGGLEII